MSRPDEEPAGDGVRREVELFPSSLLLTAALAERQADGWRLLSAGQVADGLLWGEFERGAEDEEGP